MQSMGLFSTTFSHLFLASGFKWNLLCNVFKCFLFQLLAFLMLKRVKIRSYKRPSFWILILSFYKIKSHQEHVPSTRLIIPKQGPSEFLPFFNNELNCYVRQKVTRRLKLNVVFWSNTTSQRNITTEVFVTFPKPSQRKKQCVQHHLTLEFFPTSSPINFPGSSNSNCAKHRNNANTFYIKIFLTRFSMRTSHKMFSCLMYPKSCWTLWLVSCPFKIFSIKLSNTMI